jgi:hypothetical protein
MRRCFVIGVVTIVLCMLGAGSALARGPRIKVIRGPHVAAPRFRVSYAGTGRWSTDYHSTPPNPGGNPDTNDAHDSSSQRWSLRFLEPLRWPARARSATTIDLTGATGHTGATGRINHRHLDGLYAVDNASIGCQVATSTAPHQRLPASLELSYLPGRRSLRLTALDPVAQALLLLPQQCPGQGDSLDGLSDNYFTPGFSFASGYGPDRWFRSRSVLIPIAVLQRAAAVTIRLGPAADAAPPADCAVPSPTWQRCRTGGTWRGTLSLRRLG